jgi:UDP-GlcNAc3NAcA epimerase
METMLHTGQHFDENMSDVFFQELEIPPPKHNLGIGGGTHGQNTGRMLEAIEQVLLAERPDVVVVFGDTNSTLAGALAASKLHIPIAHAESGLRSFNRAMPEEINRVLVDHCSDILYAPTTVAVDNLGREGIEPASIALVGDLMFDVALRYEGIAKLKSRILESLAIEPRTYVLATVHRQENTDNSARLARIVEGFAASARRIIWPLHPRVAKRLEDTAVSLPPNVTPIPPVGYLDMVTLEQHAFAIATDSGGVQKEAYFFGVPCVTLRDETEWTELIAAGANVLVGADADRISHALAAANPLKARRAGLYGNGDTALRMCGDLLARLA